MPPAPASCLPAPGVELLRCGSRTGYRNVYEHEANAHGVWYVAKVKANGALRVIPGARSRMPHVCAAAVVAWYEQRFGPDWKTAARHRKFNPRKAWYSRKRGAYLAAVWLWGHREEVRPVTKGGRVRRGSAPAEFATREQALAACERYARARWGLFWQAALWRA